jgi:hypothetical protein
MGSTGNNYSVSPEVFLSNEYELKEVEFSIDDYYDTYKFQLLCGDQIGYYYFDNFNVTIIDNNMSANENFNKDIYVFPNPTTDLINIKYKSQSSINFDIYSINGKLIKSYLSYRDNQLDLNFLDKGIYFFQFYVGNSKIINKIIKK